MSAHRRSRAARVETPDTRVVSYARRSVEKERLEFGSVEAQREAIASFVAVQRERGWTLLPDGYEDRNVSGKTTQRPGLQQMLADAEAGRFDVICLYKLDRLSRSLIDFLDLLRRLGESGVAVVSVTQSIDTSTPAGRLMLNILASFAEFEREQISERITDKMAASRRRGMWQGGPGVYGYDVVNKKLVVNETEAALVREIFETFLRVGSIIGTLADLRRRAISNKGWITQKGRPTGGRPFNRDSLRNLLTNIHLRGLIPTDDEPAEGEHVAIVPEALWERVQEQLRANHQGSCHAPREGSDAVLLGLLMCEGCGCAMTPTHTNKKGRRYSYYCCTRLRKHGSQSCPGSRVAAHVVEEQVIAHLREVARQPAVLTATVEAAHRESAQDRERLAAELLRHEQDVRRLHAERTRLVEAVARGDSKAVAGRLSEVEQRADEAAQRITTVQKEIDALATEQLDDGALRNVLLAFDPVWDELGAAEKARVLSLLLEQITFDCRTQNVTMAFRASGVRDLEEEAR